MKRKLNFCLWGIVCLCAAIACNKPVIVGPQGPQGPPGDSGTSHLVGDIRGGVQVYDTTGKLVDNFAGVQIFIDSTTLSTTSDASGYFVFTNVKAGTYNFSFKKEGYGTYRLIRQIHAGGAQYTQLGPVPVGAIYNGPDLIDPFFFNAGSPNNPTLYLNAGTTYPVEEPNAGVYYFNNVNTVSATNYRITQRIVSSPPSSDPVDPDSPPYYSAGQAISPALIRSDTVLANAANVYYGFAFDNPKEISYIDENGLLVRPCTGNIKFFAGGPNIFMLDPYSNGGRKGVQRALPFRSGKMQ